jgi:hypothetical protein
VLQVILIPICLQVKFVILELLICVFRMYVDIWFIPCCFHMLVGMSFEDEAK